MDAETAKKYIPKYISISEQIRKKIESELSVGDKVYTEKEIMEKFNVSSTTARKSLDILQNNKIIERIQGKGTFVLNKKVTRSLRKIIGLTENLEKQNISSSIKVLDKEVIEDFTEFHEKLKLSPGDKLLKLKRVRYGDGIPLVVDYRYINLKYCPDIYKKDMNISLYKLYEQYNIKIAHSKQYLKLDYLNHSDAKLLNCRKGDTVIHIEGILSLEDRTPIEYEKNYWNSQIFQFQVEADL